MDRGKIQSGIVGIRLNDATYDNETIEPTLINFLYGRNGVGKTTIARAIASGEGVTWASGENADDYDMLVYGQEFIDDNFRTMGDLPGVFMMAEENIQIQDQIDEKTKLADAEDEARRKATEELEACKGSESQLATSFQEAVWKLTADLRDEFPEAFVGKKTKRPFADHVLTLSDVEEQDLAELGETYRVAYDKTAQTYSMFSRVAQAPRYGQLPGVELLAQRVISSSDTEFARFMNAINASDWVRQGHEHYSEAAKGKCPYCQQDLPKNFEATLAASFDEQYGRDIEALATLQSSYDAEMPGIVRQLRANLDGAMPALDLDDYKAKVELLDSRVKTNSQRIAAKVKEPTKEVSLEDTDSLLIEIGTVIDELNKKIQANNDVVGSKKTAQEGCKARVWKHVAFLLQEAVSEHKDKSDKLKASIDAANDTINEANRTARGLRAEIRELNKRVVNTSVAAESINAMLADAGFQGFTLREQSGAQNVYEVIRENGMVADKLSEGERNFIAFLYFYQLVFGSDNPDGAKKKIVVIDDPVSSMDSSSLFIVGALVRTMIQSCANNVDYEGNRIEGDDIKQLFVMTHNVYFHREVTYDQVQNNRYVSFYIIRKADNTSTIKLCAKKGEDGCAENYNPVQNSYAALWDELAELSSPIPVMNVIRQILEYYFLQLCGYPGDDIRKRVLEENKEKFVDEPEEEGGKPDLTRYHLATAMLSHISNQVGISDGLHYVEDCEDADQYKAVLRIIFDALGQSQHYDMMTKARV